MLTPVDVNAAPPVICPIRSTWFQSKADELTLDRHGFASAMTALHASGEWRQTVRRRVEVAGAELSDLAVKSAFKSVTSGLPAAWTILSGMIGSNESANAMGAIKPFAAGGVSARRPIFRCSNGGRACRRSPDRRRSAAQRGADGRLGVALAGGGGAQCYRAHRDARRRELPALGGLHHRQIARAVARGQRSL